MFNVNIKHYLGDFKISQAQLKKMFGIKRTYNKVIGQNLTDTAPENGNVRFFRKPATEEVDRNGKVKKS